MPVKFLLANSLKKFDSTFHIEGFDLENKNNYVGEKPGWHSLETLKNNFFKSINESMNELIEFLARKVHLRLQI